MNNLAKKISLTLKTLRVERGWSLDTAAKKTGVSKAMLGQVEREESSPTIATLWKIAAGFDVSFTSFIEQVPTPEQEVVHHSGEMKPLHKDDEKVKVNIVFPFNSHLNFEVFMIELLPGCTHLSPPHQTGVTEHVIAVVGNVEVLMANTWHVVSENQGLEFKANVIHGYRNVTEHPIKFTNIIHYPMKSKR